MEDGKLIVTLSHGGVELIRARKIDLLITKLIREQFGLQVSLDFDGVLTVEADSPAYIEKQKNTQEKLRRAAVEEDSEPV